MSKIQYPIHEISPYEAISIGKYNVSSWFRNDYKHEWKRSADYTYDCGTIDSIPHYWANEGRNALYRRFIFHDPLRDVNALTLYLDKWCENPFANGREITINFGLAEYERNYPKVRDLCMRVKREKKK